MLTSIQVSSKIKLFFVFLKNKITSFNFFFNSKFPDFRPRLNWIKVSKDQKVVFCPDTKGLKRGGGGCWKLIREPLWLNILKTYPLKLLESVPLSTSKSDINRRKPVFAIILNLTADFWFLRCSDKLRKVLNFLEWFETLALEKVEHLTPQAWTATFTPPSLTYNIYPTQLEP